MGKCIALKRFKDAWSLAAAIDEPDYWRELGMAAMHHLDVELGEMHVRMYVYACLYVLMYVRTYMYIHTYILYGFLGMIFVY